MENRGKTRNPKEREKKEEPERTKEKKGNQKERKKIREPERTREKRKTDSKAG